MFPRAPDPLCIMGLPDVKAGYETTKRRPNRNSR